MSKEYTSFDKTKEYKEYIKPHIDEILRLVTIHKIPFVANFVLKTDENDTSYETSIVSPDEFSMNLKNDLFSNLFLCFNGGKMTLKELSGDFTDEQLKYIEELEELNEKEVF